MMRRKLKRFVEDNELTEKEKLFCMHYLRHFNAAKAYRDAGYAATKFDKQAAHKMLRIMSIQWYRMNQRLTKIWNYSFEVMIMRKRDLEILQSLGKFKCLDRDQIVALHFSNNKNPIESTNRVLKRLRTSGYIQANTNRSFQQYIYFLNPSPIKTDSQKIYYYLMIAQGYIDMYMFSSVKLFNIEPKIDHAAFIPDATCNWLGNDWF